MAIFPILSDFLFITEVKFRVRVWDRHSCSFTEVNLRIRVRVRHSYSFTEVRVRIRVGVIG